MAAKKPPTKPKPRHKPAPKKTPVSRNPVTRALMAAKKTPKRKPRKKVTPAKPDRIMTRAEVKEATTEYYRQLRQRQAGKPKRKTGKKRGRPKRKGPKPFKPLHIHRIIVAQLVARGIQHEHICRLLVSDDYPKGVSDETMRKYFRDELDLGRSKANNEVAGNLYLIATMFPPMPGTVTAAIAWMNNNAGWSQKHTHEGNPDKPVEHKHEIIKDDKTVAGILAVLREVGVLPGHEDEG